MPDATTQRPEEIIAPVRTSAATSTPSVTASIAASDRPRERPTFSTTAEAAAAAAVASTRAASVLGEVTRTFGSAARAPEGRAVSAAGGAVGRSERVVRAALGPSSGSSSRTLARGHRLDVLPLVVADVAEDVVQRVGVRPARAGLPGRLRERAGGGAHDIRLRDRLESVRSTGRAAADRRRNSGTSIPGGLAWNSSNKYKFGEL